MRSRNFLAAAHNSERRTARRNRVAGRLILLALFVVLAIPALLVGLRHAGAQLRTTAVQGRATTATQSDSKTAAPPTATHIQPVSVTEVSFKQLVAQQARAAAVKRGPAGPAVLRQIHAPMTAPEPSAPATAAAQSGNDSTAAAPPVLDDAGGPLVPSPTPSTSYLGQEDGPKIGSTEFDIPPDTQGAVGIDKVFVNTNSNYRIQNKATGAALSTVSSDTFWTGSGGSGFFDPRITYDPYNDRWILAEDSNSVTANSSIEIAVSQTSDPQGTYNVYRFVVGNAVGSAAPGACGEWADFPMLGFNKNWITVSMNMFPIQTSGTSGTTTCTAAFVEGKVLVLDYPQARAGTAVGTLFTGASIGFCLHPVKTFDPNEPTLYMPQHLSSGGASYDLGAITGTPSAPVLGFIGGVNVRPGGGWTQSGAEALSQQCVPGFPTAAHVCPATIRRMDAGDSQIRSNPVFRNGNIWYSQTIILPAGGSITTASHVAVQWTKIGTTGAFVDGGRVQDPTATLLNGGKLYAYSSLSVNKNDDMMIGFSQFASNQFAAAGYSFRFNSDTAGTTRDPIIYKAGEDYYSKTFSGTVNRWGDYSATHVDPVNDRDMWTIQEYAGTRIPPGTGSNDSRWGTYWAALAVPAGAGDLLISEFRESGPGGANDEFIEIYNNNNSPLTVTTTDGSAGYAVVSASNAALNDGTPTVRCTIPTGTVIPGRGHYLCTNSVGYSLASYPAGVSTTATGDATYATDIPQNDGLAIFNTANPANFSTTTRLDAVGSSSVTNTLYREGAGYAPLAGGASALIEASLYRDLCGKGGSVTQLGGCPTLGFPRDTNNNAVDFILDDTNGTPTGGQQRLGAPGPENLSSPVQRNSTMPGFNLDATVSSSSPPNRVRDFTSDPANNSTFGTLDIRKRIVNNTGSPVTRLRFRIIDISTFPSASTPGFADMRARTSTAVVVSGVNDPATCPGGVTPCTVTVQGTTLEVPPTQPNGGAFNSSLSAGTIALATPLAPGASINVRFLLGLQGTGTFKFFVNVEALP
ncbi:MAG: hypothetical protein QOH51_1311 [Acidobacteriota bacterium]|nr:hypothetical protein [Acidobacteriota bacterium]